MPTQAKEKTIAANLYELLSDTKLLTDEEREFWLESFQDLSPREQKDLLKILNESSKELGREHERHQSHIAEISAKLQTRTKKLSAYKSFGKQNQSKDNHAVKNASRDEAIDSLDDELLRQLEEWGERT